MTKDETEDMQLENVRLLVEVNDLSEKAGELQADLETAEYDLSLSSDEIDDLNERVDDLERDENVTGVLPISLLSDQMKFERLAEIWSDLTLRDIEKLQRKKRPNDVIRIQPKSLVN